MREKCEERICIPATGYMVADADGKYQLNKEKSQWISVYISELAMAIVQLNGGKAPLALERKVAS